MFSINHFIWLGICIIIIVGLLLLDKKFKFSFFTATLIMCEISLASEFCKILTHIQNPPDKWGFEEGGLIKDAKDKRMIERTKERRKF